MADKLQACCLKARDEYVQRLLLSIISFPVIKTIPCPTCRKVIPIRVYARPEEQVNEAS